LERIEEKFILDYRQYSLIKSRVSKVLRLDAHSGGCYQISSLYFDDPHNSAYFEKTFGLSVHSKFRIRTYNCSENMIKLEKKTKRGVRTKKESALYTKKDLLALSNPPIMTEAFSGKLLRLAAELQSKGNDPVLTVRYNREAFYLDGLGVRVTFDSDIQSLPRSLPRFLMKREGHIPRTRTVLLWR
jgi:SPX domain protein involved in polyphosphate accumulation